MQSNPLGIDDGPNTYLYVANSPLLFMDPLGLFKQCIPWRSEDDWIPTGRQWTNNDEIGTAAPNFFTMTLKCKWVREWYVKFECKVVTKRYCMECTECTGGCDFYVEEESEIERKTDKAREGREENYGCISVSYGHLTLCTCCAPWSGRVEHIRCER